MRRVLFRTVCFVLLFSVTLVCCTPIAFAEFSQSLRDQKGTAPAEAPWIQEDQNTDGSVYENPPTEVRFVRIGLRYGENAVEEVALENTSGAGFRIGVYDENREFVERARTDCSMLQISWAAHEENGLMILGGEEQELLYLSREEDSLAVEPISGETQYEGNAYRGGFECRKAEERLISLVNVVELEDYVKGVLPYEMANNWPLEALKAQAVCARTYVVYNQNSYEEYGFDLTDNTESQVYRGTNQANDWTDAAVEATAGELIRYRGEICEIYYFAADGGATEDGKYVFDTPRPYLRGKLDPFEKAVDYSLRSWQVSYTGKEISRRLERRGYFLNEITELRPELSAMGNVIAITFTDDTGTQLRLEGRRCYTVLGLYDCRFQIDRDEDGFVFTGSGLGHNCGMSQWGARAMDEVYGYDYRDIIGFYYTGAYIA